MRARARRFRYSHNPLEGGYPGVTVFDGAEKVGRIDWCMGRFHLVIEGYGYIGVYRSENCAKEMLRHYVRQFRAQRPAAARAAS